MKNRKKRHHGSKKKREHRRRKKDKNRRKKRQKEEEDIIRDEPHYDEQDDEQDDEGSSETGRQEDPNIYIKKRMFHPDIMMHWYDVIDPRRNNSFHLFDPFTRHDDVPPPPSFPFPEITLTTILPRGPLRGFVVHSPGLGLFEIDLGQFLPHVVFNTYEYIEDDDESDSTPVKKQGHFYLCKLVNFKRRFQATPDKIHDLQKIIYRLLSVSDGWVEVRIFGIDRYWKLLVDIEFPGFLGSLRTWLLDEAGDVVERFNK